VDSDEDVVSADVPVNYYDFVPEMFSEEGQLRRDRVKDILETEIVRLSPFKLDSEDEETMERVASPMVVETVNDLADAGVASCSTDIDVNTVGASIMTHFADKYCSVDSKFLRTQRS